MNNFKLIEALMYIQGAKGLTPKNLKVAGNFPTLNARKLLKAFKEEFNALDRGIFVVEFNDVYKFATREEYKEAITQMVIVEKRQKLSGSAIEAAGIIAYKQPITKSQVNEIRGVASEAVVNTLLLKGIIEEKGIAQTPGSPVLYGISDKFYDYFQIQSLNELPKLAELSDQETDEDFDLFGSQRQD